MLIGLFVDELVRLEKSVELHMMRTLGVEIVSSLRWVSGMEKERCTVRGVLW